MSCGIEEISVLMGRKWSIGIIEEIGIEKFIDPKAALKKIPGVDKKTLFSELDSLEKDGIIEKKTNNAGSEIYELSVKGRDVHKIIGNIKEWNIKWHGITEDCLTKSCLKCSMYKGNLVKRNTD